MKILKVWDADYPWDVRVEKVCRALHGAGHEVHLVARNRQRRERFERLPYATVHRLGNFGLLGRAIDDAISFPAFCNPRWVRLIHGTASRAGAELILCRDLPLAPAAIWAGRRLGVPVVLDMAENYPAMIRAMWDARRQRPHDWLVRNPAAVARVEQWAIRRVDHILVVVEESRERLTELGVSGDRITIVSNTPSKSRPASLAHPSRGERSGGLHLVYLGLLEAPRGIGTLIEAIARCRDRGLDVRATIIGDGRERALFEEKARALALLDREVVFLGYVPYEDALDIVASADVGVIPHFSNDSWNSTIPNKLFDYMAAGIPVLTADARPAARVVRQSGCGVVFESGNADAMASAIESLADPEFRRRCGANGRQAIQDRYNWEIDAQRLLEAVEKVGGRLATRAELSPRFA